MTTKSHPDLGSIPEHWDIAEIGDVADVTKLAGYEFTEHIKYIEDGEIIALRSLNVVDGQLDLSNIKRIAKSVSDELPRSKLVKNDLLLTYTGSKLGDTALIDANDKYHLAPNVCRLRANEDDNAYFLYLFLRSNTFAIILDKFKVGSGQPTVPMKNIRKIPLPWPPHDERKITGNIYSSLNDKIELNRRMNATLEAMAQALFKSWFVDFDPVRAKMEGRQPSGMDEETVALFPDRLVDSGAELGMIPEGWEVGSISDFALINPEVWNKSTAPNRITYVDLAGTKNGVVNSTEPYKFKDAPSRARRVLRDGDTLIGTVRPGNRSFTIIDNPAKDLTGSTGFAVLRPIKNEYRYYIYIALTRDEVIDYLAALAHGSAYPAVSPEIIHQLKVIVPQPEVLRGYHELVVPLMKKRSINLKQSQTLVALRDTLLPKLLSGEVRVKEAEKMMEGAA